MSNKKKNTGVPFQKYVFTEFLKESVIGNSSTTVVCCLNGRMCRTRESGCSLRLAQSWSKLMTNPKEVRLSMSSLMKVYSDALENIGNTISMWVKEFWGFQDRGKLKRVRIVVNVLGIMERQVSALLDGFEQQMQIDLIKNALFGKILDIHCKEYSDSITSEDIREFYIAKMEKYTEKKVFL